MVATAGEIKFGDGAPPSWSGPGVGAMYFRSTTGLPYARNSQSGIEMPLGIGQNNVVMQAPQATPTAGD